MYWNDTMARKARMMVSKMRHLRQSRVRPYRERNEITPLLSAFKDTNGGRPIGNGIKMNGINGHASGHSSKLSNGTTITIQNQLYPIEEDDIGWYTFYDNK